MMKRVVREMEACNVSTPRTSTPRLLGIQTLLQAGAHGNTWASVGPIRVQNLKAFRALESAYNRDPHSPWALWKTGNIIIASGASAHNDNFHTRVSSFIGQHFGKKISLLPTAGAENHAVGGFTASPPADALKV